MQRPRSARVRAAAGWLSTRHSLTVEVATVLLLYALYETSRGLMADHAGIAMRHAHDVVALERALHLFVERDVQNAAQAVPGLIGTLGFLYLTLHLSVTAGYLLWLHRRRPALFPLVRTTLLLASGLALVGYFVFPTAPPRLAGIGLADTVSNAHIDLNDGLVSSLYNPFAAVPSMHFGYALVIAASLLHPGKRRVARTVAAVAYPLLVLLVIVATGNHFLFDAVAGAAVAGIAAALSLRLTRARSDHRARTIVRLGPLTLAREPSRAFEEPFDGRKPGVVSPDRVDRQHRSRWGEVDELDAARKLLDQGADDKADAAALRDVTPDGRPGSVLVDRRREAGGMAGGDDRVVIPGRHLVRPELEGLVAQLGELDPVDVGETVAVSSRDSDDFAPDGPLADVLGIGRERGEREVAGVLAQELGDVAAEDLAGMNLEQGKLLVEPGEQQRHGLECADERVDEPQGAGLAARCSSDAQRGAVGAGEQPSAIGEKDHSLGRELHAPRRALEQRDAEQLLKRLDLLAHRLLRDVQLPGCTGEAAAFGDRGEVAHLTQIGGRH
jgi:hypothetical protein